MKILAVTAAVSFVVGVAPASAAPSFDCTGSGRAPYKIVCADPELVRLDRALDAALGPRVMAADPLTAMLLRRDQGWFADLLSAQNVAPFAGPVDPQRRRILDALQERRAMVERLNTIAAEQPEGQWANAFSTAKVERRPDGALTIEVVAKTVYAELDHIITCGATAQMKSEDDGWLAGPALRTSGDDAAGDKDSAGTGQSPFRLRLRLQANTLRIALMPSEQDTICGTPEQITGTYFALGSRDAAPSPAAAVAARTVSPSFACATAKTSDEEEICSDPDLAARDAEITVAYREALRALDAKSAGFLRDDQRAFIKENAAAYDDQLHPPWDKQNYIVHQTGNAREELFLRLNERRAMLSNLELARQGTAGLWVGHNTLLAIVPDRNDKKLLHAAGRKWATGDYKSHCDFEADGRLHGGIFRTEDGFPALARDGATLTLDGKDPDQTRDRKGNHKRAQPDYCTRMDSAKARLFPVKAGAAIDTSDGRIR